MDNHKDIKRKFIYLLDGIGANAPGIEPDITSFRIGLCHLQVVDGTLHVYVRRPGLLIGVGGKTMMKFQDKMEMEFHIHEVDFIHKPLKPMR